MSTVWNPRHYLHLYFVAGTQNLPLSDDPENALLSCLKDAIAGGITCFQLREKGRGSLNTDRIPALATACRDICRDARIPFFIDDDVALALKIGADGIHVGQSDMPIAEIKKLSGSLQIGLSTHTPAQALAAQNADILPDYIAAGPIFPTFSKENPAPAVGLGYVRNLRELGIVLPLVAIGGITAPYASQLREEGANGIAVVSAIAGVSEKEAAARVLAA